MGRVDGNSWPRLSRVGDGDGRVLEERRADVKALAGASCAIRGRGRGRDGREDLANSAWRPNEMVKSSVQPCSCAGEWSAATSRD